MFFIARVLISKTINNLLTLQRLTLQKVYSLIQFFMVITLTQS